MADVKKCDRCGVCYKPLTEIYIPGVITVTWTNSVDLKFTDAEAGTEKVLKSYDLCPRCVRALKKFMRFRNVEDEDFDGKEVDTNGGCN